MDLLTVASRPIMPKAMGLIFSAVGLTKGVTYLWFDIALVEEVPLGKAQYIQCGFLLCTLLTENSVVACDGFFIIT